MELISLPILIISAFIGLVGAGALLAIVLMPMAQLRKRIIDRVTRWRGDVPWLDRDLVVLGDAPGQHQTIFVSRHHLAEGGIECPICKRRVADAGDFSTVQRVMVDGQENECIVCPGEREVENGRMVPCKTVMLASPDTEHGDHLDEQGEVDPKGIDPPEYFRFVRAPADQHLREKWGVDTSSAGPGDDAVIAPGRPEGTPDVVRANGAKDDVLIAMPTFQPAETPSKDTP